jgi:hypothetical protein
MWKTSPGSGTMWTWPRKPTRSWIEIRIATAFSYVPPGAGRLYRLSGTVRYPKAA